MTSAGTETETGTVGTAEPGGLIEVQNPATGAVAGQIPNQTAEEVEAAAAKLRAAQPAWEALGFKGRARHLEAWRDWYLDNEERLIEMVQQESGKTLTDSVFELPIALEVINYYVKHGEDFLKPETPHVHAPTMATKRLLVEYHPHQLLGLITPWNGPIGNPMLDLPQALLAGCAVLCKPSEFTPLTWRECIRGWNEDIGAPHVLGCVTGAGETGRAVVETVDMIHFTGSAATGRKIAARCGERLIPCSLELGGKDPMVVLADADLERAAGAAVWGAFTNSGQICVSVERVYVEEPIYDDFVKLVAEKTGQLRQGFDPVGGKVSMEVGAMANEQQVEIVKRHVDGAIADGAKALTGGKVKQSDGLYFEPTVLVDVDHSMACMREETFGPTMPVMKVKNQEEAINLANDSDYGLSASVWTKDRERGENVARQLHAGAVNINNVFMNLFNFPVPQGGWGESGVGARLGGADGIRKYCKKQAVVSERVAGKSEVHWYPVSDRKTKLQGKGARFMGAKDWRRKLGLKPRQ